jgi:hypothetical protein
VDYSVRDGRVEATVRPVAPNTYQQPVALFVFDHATMAVREVHVDLPTLGQSDPPRNFVVDALAERRVLSEGTAPDGYRFVTRASRGPGLVGDLFGMRRDATASIVRNGRVVAIELPSQYQFTPSVHALGWLADEPIGGAPR